MLEDLRHTFRGLRRSPRFTLAAVLTLALGIGPAVAVFSVVNAVLLRSLPFDHPERVVGVWIRGAPTEGLFGISGGAATVVRRLPAVEHVATVIGARKNLMSGGDAEVVEGAHVSEDFFAVFGVPAALGRVLDRRDVAAPGRAVVLSDQLWRRRLGADTQIVGRNIRFDDGLFTVVGVMPRAFSYPEDAEYWINRETRSGEKATIGRGAFLGVARLRSRDLTAAQSQAATASTMFREDGAASRDRLTFVPLIETTAGQFRSALQFLLLAVALVLLVACANVANLLLARATERVEELSVRSAIGATRYRLFRLLFVESLLIATVAGLAGLSIAWLLVRMIPMLAAPSIPRLGEATLDWRTLAFMAASAACSVCLFGLVPGWLAIRRTCFPVAAGKGASVRGARTASRLLVAGEVAATLALLIGCMLTLANIHRLLNVPLGFEPQQLTMARIAPPYLRYPGAARSRFCDTVLQRLRDTPGIKQAVVMSNVPLDRYLANPATVSTANDGNDATRPPVTAGLRVISAGTVATLRVPLLAGREFADADRDGAELVAVVNASLADRLWPGREPLGQAVWVKSGQQNEPKTPYRVVGVTGNIRGSVYRDAGPEIYLSAGQRIPTQVVMVVSSPLDMARVAGAIREAVRKVDPAVPVSDVTRLRDLAVLATAYSRFQTMLLTLFAALALILAASGILAVVTYAVARRTREMGIRIAVGARPADVILLLLGDLTPSVCAGVGVGFLAAYCLSTVLKRVVFGVRSVDGATALLAAGGIVILTVCAAWIPARRATRIDPVAALRSN